MTWRDYVFPIFSNKPRVVPLNTAPLVTPQALYDTAHSFFAGSYQYINTTGNQPTPGAEAFAFAQQTLPLTDWKGSGDLVQKNMMINSRQLYVTKSVIPTGLAGIGAGQVFAGNLQAQDLSG